MGPHEGSRMNDLMQPMKYSGYRSQRSIAQRHREGDRAR